MLTDLFDKSIRLIVLRGKARVHLRSGLRVVTRAGIGERLVLGTTSDARPLVTSRIVRILKDVGAEGAYVETDNSVYLLQTEPSHAHDRTPTERGGALQPGSSRSRVEGMWAARARARERLAFLTQQAVRTPRADATTTKDAPSGDTDA